MEVNVPGFNNVNMAIPERAKGKFDERTKGKNAVVLSQNGGSNHNDPRFLSNDFLKDPPRLYVTAEDKDFDVQIINDWRNEGFLVEYVPMGNGGEQFVEKLERMGKKKLGPCETYGVVGECCPMPTITLHLEGYRDRRCIKLTDPRYSLRRSCVFPVGTLPCPRQQ